MPVTCFIFTWFILKWTGPGFPLEREEIEAVLPSTVYLTRILIKAEQSTATGRSTWLCECVVADGVGLPSLPIIFADEGETSPLGTWPGALDLAIDSPPSPLPLLPPAHLHPSDRWAGAQGQTWRQYLSQGPLTRDEPRFMAMCKQPLPGFVKLCWLRGLLAGG